MIAPVFGLKGVLIGLAVASAAGFGTGWMLNGWRLGAAVEKCRADSARRDAEAATATVDQVARAATAVADAASAVAEAGARSAAANEAARRRWAELVKATPLPDGCKPDQARAEAFGEAVKRTQEAMR